MEVHKILNCQSNPNILKMQIISYCLILNYTIELWSHIVTKKPTKQSSEQKKKTNNRYGLKTDIHIIVIDREPLSNQRIYRHLRFEQYH